MIDLVVRGDTVVTPQVSVRTTEQSKGNGSSPPAAVPT